MRWLHLVAYLFGGAFLANALPHLLTGITGGPFQSPFASPPGVGLSSSLSNVGWGLGNLLAAYLLLLRVGRLDLRRWDHFAALFIGFAGMALMLARYFGQFHGGLV